MTSRIVEIFFLLLRTTLYEKQRYIVSLQKDEWCDLFILSKQQGVSSLIFNAIATESNIASELKIEWSIHNLMIARNYEQQKNALEKFTGLLQQINVEAMLLKGLSLAELFPNPETRECGDVDIFTSNNYNIVNQHIKNQGIKIETEDSKHCNFVFENIAFENHQNFTYDFNHADRVINKWLSEHIQENIQHSEALPRVSIPAPDNNALYIMQHTINHLVWSGIVMRQLCDWVLFLKRYHEQLDWNFLKKIWSDANILDSVSMINKLCINTLNMPKEWFPIITEVSENDCNYLYSDIISPIPSIKKTTNLIKKTQYKIKQHRARQTKHKLIYHTPYPDSLLKTLLLWQLNDLDYLLFPKKKNTQHHNKL